MRRGSGGDRPAGHPPGPSSQARSRARWSGKATHHSGPDRSLALRCLVGAAVLVTMGAAACDTAGDPAARPAPAVGASARSAGTPEADEPITAAPIAKPAAYVGRDACAACHPEELERWRGSDHDLAMQPADESTVLGDFSGTTFEHGGVTSTFFRRGDRFLVRTDGPRPTPGGPLPEERLSRGSRSGESSPHDPRDPRSRDRLHEYEIAYTFGVHPLQQYLIAFPGGRLQALGIAWDTRPAAAGGQRWFHLYPEERGGADDPLHWTGRNQTWNYMCADCHSTDLRKNYRAADDTYDTRWAELDVSCEACHGPGSLHVERARAAAATVADGPAPDAATPGADAAAPATGNGLLVHFAEDGAWAFAPGAVTASRTPPRRSHAEVETCARCHARRSVIEADYVHGHPLMDTHRPALLDQGLYQADGQILEEVYVYGSFLQSRMYAAGVSCSDCHEPHSARLRAEGNALCGRCHLPAHFDTQAHHFHEPGQPGSRCIDCHMPVRTYMIVDPRRDHSFRVPRPDLSSTIGTSDPCTDCHAERSAAWAASTLARRYGPARAHQPHYGTVLHAGRQDLPGAGKALAGLIGDARAPGIVRATALELLRAHLRPNALPVVERALDDPDPLVRMAAAEATEGLDARTRLRLVGPLVGDPVRAVRLAAAVTLADVEPGLWNAADRAALERALDEYRRAQLLNAERPDAHLNLGLLHVRRGEMEPARAAYERALRIDPGFVPAYVNLADLHRLQNQDLQGERVLRQALALAPQSAEVHHALGLLLVRTGRTGEATEELGRAAALGPDDARHAYVYGVALHSTGDTTRALAVLAEAHARRPGDRDVVLALATISRDAGMNAAAADWAAKLLALDPDDAGARRLSAELQGAAAP